MLLCKRYFLFVLFAYFIYCLSFAKNPFFINIYQKHNSDYIKFIFNHSVSFSYIKKNGYYTLILKDISLPSNFKKKLKKPLKYVRKIKYEYKKNDLSINFYPIDNEVKSIASSRDYLIYIQFYKKSELRQKSTTSFYPESYKLYVIIDPGHGGKDPGAINKKNGLKEKDIVLSIALKLAQYLSKTGNIKPILTRKTDKYLSLNARGKICEKYKEKAKLFISLHLNSVGRRSRIPYARGLEIYYLNPAGASRVEAKHAEELENFEGKYYNPELGRFSNLNEAKPLLRALLDKSIRENMIYSQELCEFISSEMKKIPYYKIYYRGIYDANFKVLRNINMPCVLIELGFISHPEESILLNNAVFQDIVARAIANGIIAYLHSKNKRLHVKKFPMPEISYKKLIYKRKTKMIKYKVKKGDTLYRIARKFKTSISKIKRFNRLKNSIIRPGQVIFVPR